MTKLNLHTPNLVDKNIKKIAELFPNVVTEVIRDGETQLAIDFDMLKQELSDVVVEGAEERYQFIWPDKRKSKLLANAPTYKTLRPCRDESVDFDATENLYIEGDNLDALKILQETYLGKVKMIYIDPPYNTGKDFIYADDFKQSVDEYMELTEQYDEDGNQMFTNSETNGRYHTDWLNMIYPRLQLAKDLLKDDGIIFISIDDNEVENLKKVCNEVFGAWNFVAQFNWKRKKEISSDSKNVSIQGEYILCYSKDLTATLSFEQISQDYVNKSYNEPNEQFPLGKWRPVPITVSKGLSGGGYEYAIATPIGNIHNRLWAYPEKSFKELLVNNRVYFGKSNDRVPQRVIYAHESNGQPVTNYWDNVATNKEGKKEILGILGDNVFDTPKPTGLVAKMLSVATTHANNDIILDFFAGSATTAHAVIQLNAEDGGNRKFIMVQLPEVINENHEAYKAGYRTICDIGKERICRAAQKIKSEQGLMAQDLDTGFRVLKVDSTNMKDIYYCPEQMAQDTLEGLIENIKEDRTPEDLLFQVMLELGALLSCKIESELIDGKQVFIVSQGGEVYLIACFDNKVSSSVVTAIAKRQPYYAVFRDKSMDDDSLMTSFEQIFEAYSKHTVRKVL